jgi:glutamyl-tRNA reductase
MKLQMLGCSHHGTPLEVRELLAFSEDQCQTALAELRQRFPECESVLISTCNRVELYTASSNAGGCPTTLQLVDFLAGFHRLDPEQICRVLSERSGEDAVRHLFMVASSLDSMVVGEAQILSQVKQAYALARTGDSAGPLINAFFQAALRVAKRIATETSIHERRVSIPSVAVADFAAQIFERFDDKSVLVIGAGEMGEETLRYLKDKGARDIALVNRNRQRAERLAASVGGRVLPWEQLYPALVAADLVIGTTGSDEPILTAAQYEPIHVQRQQRPLFMLDLAVPRDFEAAIGDFLGVYLYSIDDLKRACEANRRAREKEWPKAERIIQAETARFLADLNHRATGPTIKRLRQQADRLKVEEMQRLLNKLGTIDERSRLEIEQSFDRLVNKLLHPPLERLRDEAERGSHHGLLDALTRLFQLKD